MNWLDVALFFAALALFLTPLVIAVHRAFVRMDAARDHAIRRSS